MSNLDFYKGHWSAIPHALATLTSGNAFLLLFNIIRNSSTAIPVQPIKISKNKLAMSMGVSRHTVDNCINELSNLNLLSASERHGHITSFVINWDEIETIHGISSMVDDYGWGELRKVCANKPCSRIERPTCAEIAQVYKRKYDTVIQTCAEREQAEELVQKLHKFDNNTKPTCEKTAQVETELVKKLHKLDVNSQPTCAEIAQVIDEMVRYLSGIMATCEKTAQVKKILTRKLLDAELLTCAEIAQVVPQTCEKTAQVAPKTCAKTAHSIDIYKDIEKDEASEASYKGGEKKEKILEWFNNRDLSFPVLSSSDFDTIINLPDFSDEDYDKAVRQVWGYLQYDDDPENIENNLIPAELFMDFLFRAWNDLKEIDPDFSLSEQDMKNIFGFDLEEHDGELFCLVSPNKLRDVTVSPQPVKRLVRERGMKDRARRTLFVEAVTEIASQDEKLLSDTEYIVWRIVKTVEENKANGQPRYDEMTKLQFNDLIGIWSEETAIPANDIKNLLREMPQKGIVHLSPSQLLPEKFFKYNHDHNDTTNVEELFNKKLLEYENGDGEQD